MTRHLFTFAARRRPIRGRASESPIAQPRTAAVGDTITPPPVDPEVAAIVARAIDQADRAGRLIRAEALLNRAFGEQP